MKKVAGFVVAGVLIAVALIIYIFSHLSLTKNDSSSGVVASTSEVSATSVVTTVSGTEVQSQDTTTTSVTESTTVSSVAESTTDTSKNNGQVLLEVDENRLVTDSAEQTSTGVVESKKCYSDGNQIVYVVELGVSMGDTEKIARYYCTSSTYQSLEIGDKLSVVYCMVSMDDFAIVRVTK